MARNTESSLTASESQNFNTAETLRIASFHVRESQTHNNKSWSEFLKNILTFSRVRKKPKDGQVKERKERCRCQRRQVKFEKQFRHDFVK